jgi:FkbM family methyltransferase
MSPDPSASVTGARTGALGPAALPAVLARALEALSAGPGLGVVVDLGAGAAPRLAACLAAGARHVALVEPNPALLRRLQPVAEADPRLSLHAAAMAAEDGTGTLQILSLPALSSLRAPADLADLFPGLRVTGRAEVETLSPASLLARLPPPGPAPDLLVIDTPGAEAEVIEGLAAAGALSRFGWILLRCGTTGHYAGSLPAATLCARLEAAGFRLEIEDAADPDRPWFGLRRDALAAERDALTARLAELEAALAGARKATRAAEARAREAGAGRDALAARAEAAEAGTQALREELQQRAQERDALTARLAELEAALAGAREATGAAEARAREAGAGRDALAARAEAAEAGTQALREELQQRAQERDVLTARLAELEAALAGARQATRAANERAQEAFHARDALAVERDTLAVRNQELAIALAEAEQAGEARAQLAARERDGLAREVAELQAERERARSAQADRLEEMRGDLVLALRLQAQREADLRDLQDRHAALLAEKDRQDELLRQLTERLTLAAQYLRLQEPARLAPPEAGAGTALSRPPGRKGKDGKAKKGKKKAGR